MIATDLAQVIRKIWYMSKFCLVSVPYSMFFVAVPAYKAKTSSYSIVT